MRKGKQRIAGLFGKTSLPRNLTLKSDLMVSPVSSRVGLAEQPSDGEGGLWWPIYTLIGSCAHRRLPVAAQEKMQEQLSKIPISVGLSGQAPEAKIVPSEAATSSGGAYGVVSDSEIREFLEDLFNVFKAEPSGRVRLDKVQSSNSGLAKEVIGKIDWRSLAGFDGELSREEFVQHGLKSEDVVKKLIERRKNSFIPTKDWEPVGAGQHCPPGLEFKINLQTGEKLARLYRP